MCEIEWMHVSPSAIYKVPKSEGVYCVKYTFMGEEDEFLYIGMALNLRRRIRSQFHLVSRAYNEKTESNFYKSVCVCYYQTNDSSIVERGLIKKLSPPFNKYHNAFFSKRKKHTNA